MGRPERDAAGREGCIGPDGRERFAADPMADHTAQGTSYLPAGQVTAWGAGIAKVAGILAG